MIDVKLMNPFLKGAMTVIKTVCNMDVKIGAPKQGVAGIENDSMTIMVGVTGALTGQVCIGLEDTAAKSIASGMMMGIPVPELDEMAKSAISELGNMIMGNSATFLSEEGVQIDITPPTIITGEFIISSANLTIVQVPLEIESGIVRLSFLLKLKEA